MGMRRALPVESTAYYGTARSVACRKVNVRNCCVVVSYLSKGFHLRTSLNSTDPNETLKNAVSHLGLCYLQC